MLTEADIGKRVVVNTAALQSTEQEFYKYINGWECTLDSFESGYAVIKRPSPEYEGVTLEFKIPPNGLELVE